MTNFILLCFSYLTNTLFSLFIRFYTAAQRKKILLNIFFIVIHPRRIKTKIFFFSAFQIKSPDFFLLWGEFDRVPRLFVMTSTLDRWILHPVRFFPLTSPLSFSNSSPKQEKSISGDGCSRLNSFL